MSPMRLERAAGGVVIRQQGDVREVLLIDDKYGKVSFPKGHLEAKESWEEAALREVLEETGIEARILAPLGRVEYRIDGGSEPVRKQVRLFLMEAIDETVVPVAQTEELPAAYYLPWDQAVSVVAQRGYDNWNWLMARVDTEYEWCTQQWEEQWRKLPSETPFHSFLEAWNVCYPLLQRMTDAVRAEIAVCVPEWSSRLPLPRAVAWPVTISDEQESLIGALEHTVLRPDATVLDVERLCAEALEHQFACVCVNPQHVAAAAELLADTDVAVCTVVGFPLGATQTKALQAEVEAAIAAGAQEVDMVIPVGAMVEDDVWTVYQHIAAVVDEAHFEQRVAVKVIVEAHYLTYAQLLKACMVAVAAGADFVKTSTGFAPTGARLADVAAMVMVGGDKVRVKAAGGVKSRQSALNFLRLGAARLGASASVSILRE